MFGMRSYTKRNFNNWKSGDNWALCDRSGFIVEYKDLVKEMQYSGPNLVWTGSMVHKDFVDTPNKLPYVKIVGPEMKPLKNARPIPYFPQPTYRDED